MKNTFYALILSIILFSCQQNKEHSTTYTPRLLTATESFNNYNSTGDSALTLVKYDAEKDAKNETYSLKFRDTTVRIQTDKADTSSIKDRFSFAQFVNTQKTSVLVQLADASGLTAPVYLISLKDNKLEVVSLYRASEGKEDRRFTEGITKVGRDGYLVNNDFFVTNVNSKVYLVKRQQPNERIQGVFFLKSPDKYTLAFLVQSSLYQVHYPTGETFSQALNIKVPKQMNDIYDWVQSNFVWQKAKSGASFLKENDSDRIVDIKEFK